MKTLFQFNLVIPNCNQPKYIQFRAKICHSRLTFFCGNSFLSAKSKPLLVGVWYRCHNKCHLQFSSNRRKSYCTKTQRTETATFRPTTTTTSAQLFPPSSRTAASWKTKSSWTAAQSHSHAPCFVSTITFLFVKFMLSGFKWFKYIVENCRYRVTEVRRFPSWAATRSYRHKCQRASSVGSPVRRKKVTRCCTKNKTEKRHEQFQGGKIYWFWIR